MKRIVSLVLASLMLLSLVACNKKVDAKSVDEARAIIDYKSWENVKLDDVDVINFGSYPQNDINGNKKEPIQWFVVQKQPDNSVVLVSKYVLDRAPFGKNLKNSTWPDITDYEIGEWLNTTFYDNAFNDEEKSKVLLLWPHNSKKTTKIDVGNIHLANLAPEMLKAKATNYAKRPYEATLITGKKGKFTLNNVKGYAEYWFEDWPNPKTNTIKIVKPNGEIAETENTNFIKGIRPIIRISY